MSEGFNPQYQSAPRIVKGAFWLHSRWPELVDLISGISLVVGALLISKDFPTWAIIVGVILLVAGIVGVLVGKFFTWRKVPEFARLKQAEADLDRWLEIARSQYKKLFETQLVLLAREKLDFGDTERVSYFKNEGDLFVMLGRYSSNPHFNRAGRGTYPIDKGCIGEAWVNGHAVADNLPDPDSDLEAWRDILRNEWGIFKGVSRDFNMKSRCYVAFALLDPRGIRRTSVILFESIRPNSLEVDLLKSTLAGGEEMRLVNFQRMMEPFEPQVGVASREGF